MKLVDRVVKAVVAFDKEKRDDPYGRYRSWEHCYKNFIDARSADKPDYDYLSLQLAFYLASWGMYRGSSFLLRKDYRVHIPVVKELLKSKYDCLAGIECKDLRDKTVLKKLRELEDSIIRYYSTIRDEVKDVKNDLSKTLITKILMGTLGCVPAYDRYFVDGGKKMKVTTGRYSHQSLLKLADFYEENREKLEKTRKSLKAYNKTYPQMKLLDMGFWKIGYDLKDRED